VSRTILAVINHTQEHIFPDFSMTFQGFPGEWPPWLQSSCEVLGENTFLTSGLLDTHEPAVVLYKLHQIHTQPTRS